MDIAALSMGMSQAKIAQQTNISVLKMAMDMSKNQSADLTRMLQMSTGILEQSVQPHLGAKLDITI